MHLSGREQTNEDILADDAHAYVLCVCVFVWECVIMCGGLFFLKLTVNVAALAGFEEYITALAPEGVKKSRAKAFRLPGLGRKDKEPDFT